MKKRDTSVSVIELAQLLHSCPHTENGPHNWKLKRYEFSTYNDGGDEHPATAAYECVWCADTRIIPATTDALVELQGWEPRRNSILR